ncbi:MAG: flagellar hook-length control protein FliK [Planctomycetes bacterium]|nr:flagellar hook-length control protein FliK [Planctomycetota bacterium]
MGQTPSTLSGRGRLDLEGLKLQTLPQPHQVAAPVKQQPDDLGEANKGKSHEVLEDLPARKSELWVTRSGSAQSYLSGKRSKLAPSPTAVTPTLSSGGEQSSVLPKIGLAATPGSALVSPPAPVDAPLGEMPLTRAVPVKGTDLQLEALSTKDNSASVSKQIMESIHSSVQHGQRRLTIALHPAELGRVVVTLEEENGSLSGRLEVSQKQTRAEIERALPGILQSLQSSGVQIKRLDVTLSNNGNDPGPRDSAWNEPSSDSSSSHQSRRDRQEYQDAASQGPFDFAEEGLAAETHTVGDEQAPRPLFAGSGSIDLLV